jgi:glycosyltransferase involved in cell wall biosynthesis
LRIGLVVPHIFMHREILPHVIFSPATLAFDLAEGLQAAGEDVTLFSPGPVDTVASNVTADLSYFEQELAGRGDTYMELLKKHPFTFVTLSRQVQSEVVAKAFEMANNDELDVVHIYTNEEDIALPFAALCKKPVVFTHHDPFNFLVKYKSVFPRYKHLNWISMSMAQRVGMPADTNWAGNVYHGISADMFKPQYDGQEQYVAYLGRIIEPKGVHLAIEAVKEYNRTAAEPIVLKIAGKHYAGHKKDTYWQERIEPLIDGNEIQYAGFIGDIAGKQEFLGKAKALVVPSIFDEPFGMVMIEALACGTPILALSSGAIPEVVQSNTGVVVEKPLDEAGKLDEPAVITALARALSKAMAKDRHACRMNFEARFTSARMCAEHLATYQNLRR